MKESDLCLQQARIDSRDRTDMWFYDQVHGSELKLRPRVHFVLTAESRADLAEKYEPRR